MTPLLVFYILSAVLLIFRIKFAIEFWGTLYHSKPFILFMPVTIKACLGLDQTWIMTELWLRIRCTLKVSESRLRHFSLGIDRIEKRTEMLIKVGRILVMALIVCFLTAMTICFSVWAYRDPTGTEGQELRDVFTKDYVLSL